MLSCILLLSKGTIVAQDIRVDLILESVTWSGYWGDVKGPRIFFYQDSYDDNIMLLSRCVQLQPAKSNSVVINQPLNSVLVSSNTLTLVHRTFEKRKGYNSDDCYYNDSGGVDDQFEVITDETIDLNKYPPGVYFDYAITNISYALSGVPETKVISYLKIRYTPPKYNIPKSNLGQQCSDKDLKIASINSLSNFTDTMNLKFEWEYHLKGDLVQRSF